MNEYIFGKYFSFELSLDVFGDILRDLECWKSFSDKDFGGYFGCVIERILMEIERNKV